MSDPSDDDFGLFDYGDLDGFSDLNGLSDADYAVLGLTLQGDDVDSLVGSSTSVSLLSHSQPSPTSPPGGASLSTSGPISLSSSYDALATAQPAPTDTPPGPGPSKTATPTITHTSYEPDGTKNNISKAELELIANCPSLARRKRGPMPPTSGGRGGPPTMTAHGSATGPGGYSEYQGTYAAASHANAVHYGRQPNYPSPGTMSGAPRSRPVYGVPGSHGASGATGGPTPMSRHPAYGTGESPGPASSSSSSSPWGMPASGPYGVMGPPSRAQGGESGGYPPSTHAHASPYSYQSFPPPAHEGGGNGSGGYPSSSAAASSYGHYPPTQGPSNPAGPNAMYARYAEAGRAARAGYARETIKTVSPNSLGGAGYPRTALPGRFQPYASHNPRGPSPSSSSALSSSQGASYPTGYGAAGASGAGHYPATSRGGGPPSSGQAYHTPHYGGAGANGGARGQPTPPGPRPQVPFEHFSNLTVTGDGPSSAQASTSTPNESKDSPGAPPSSSSSSSALGGTAIKTEDSSSSAREHMLQYLNENFKVQLQQNAEAGVAAAAAASVVGEGEEGGASGASPLSAFGNGGVGGGSGGSGSAGGSGAHHPRGPFVTGPPRRGNYGPVPDYYRNQLEHTTEPSRHTIYSLSQASQGPPPRRMYGHDGSPSSSSSSSTATTVSSSPYGAHAHAPHHLGHHHPHHHPHYGPSGAYGHGPIPPSSSSSGAGAGAGAYGHGPGLHGDGSASMGQAAPPSYPPSGEYASRRGSLSQGHFHTANGSGTMTMSGGGPGGQHSSMHGMNGMSGMSGMSGMGMMGHPSSSSSSGVASSSSFDGHPHASASHGHPHHYTRSGISELE